MTSKSLAVLPGFTDTQLKLIRQTVASDCNAQEFDLFMEICKMNGLDPFKKQIYAFIFKKERHTKENGKWVTLRWDQVI